ncbi:hypothetical protein OH76DRAFT_1417168 [Lentinus brumalis]|uniref:Uncharacterized protein n=1 Tax=Lentinus brumalis TaxID=2498619 RepID=A0A371DH28_9APHY|nr:hypothetical protein OH76DRAFT_1417168 [Polyporus brumalis]
MPRLTGHHLAMARLFRAAGEQGARQRLQKLVSSLQAAGCGVEHRKGSVVYLTPPPPLDQEKPGLSFHRPKNGEASKGLQRYIASYIESNWHVGYRFFADRL